MNGLGCDIIDGSCSSSCLDHVDGLCENLVDDFGGYAADD